MRYGVIGKTENLYIYIYIYIKNDIIRGVQ